MATTFQDTADGSLPAELSGLGHPEATFPVNRLSVAGGGLGPLLLVGGVFMLLGGAAVLSLYLSVQFPAGSPAPAFLLRVGLAALLLGAALLASRLRHPRNEDGSTAFRGYLVYPTALARITADSCTVFAWNQIEALISPENAVGNYHVLSSDGRKIPVDRAVKGYIDLLGTILYRLKGSQLERARSQLAGGQTVPFGKFGLSRDAIEYNGKKLRWDEVTAFGVVRQQGGHRRLRIKRRGAIWPWCYAPLYGVHNEQVFFELIDEVRSARPSAWG